MNVDFRTALEQPEQGFVVDRSADSTVAMVAFGGIAGGLQIPPFEFFALAGSIPVTKVFVRDLDQAWYQRGIRGLGGSISTAADSLRSVLDDAGAARVVGFGNSAGGFGAILFGHALELDEVHAFAPQTFIDRRRRLWYRDRRWGRPIRALRRSPPDGAVDDLRPLCLAAGGPTIHVHVNASHRLDRAHADRIEGGARVTVHRHASGGHALVAHLRDTNALGAIIRGALDGPGDLDDVRERRS